MRWLFLVAYTCSGFAGLVYEVTWTRLLTLHLGHTTAAASTVVGAFLLGLAIGAALGGRWARDFAARRALHAYAAIEIGVAIVAALLPFGLRALQPLLAWAYGDGEGGVMFPLVRVATSAMLVAVPAIGLGATFPLALRWFTTANGITRQSAMLYATNTLGAAGGALAAGFVLIPSLGVTRTTFVAIGAGVVSAIIALALARHTTATAAATAPVGQKPAARRARRQAGATPPTADTPPSRQALWLAAGVLALSGAGALLHEIAWTRILALVIGPTTYAFAGALAAVVTGTALGSWLGTWMVGRTSRPALWLAVVLSLAAISVSATSSLAGRELPLLVARQLADVATTGVDWVSRGAWLTAALIAPTSLLLGLAFPLGLGVAGATRADVTGRYGLVYALNTVGAVGGSLAAGFLTIPTVGLQGTLQLACASLVGASMLVALVAALTPRGRLAASAAGAAAVATLLIAPPWDRALLASGPYLYAPFVPPGLDVEAMLKAGTLEYYREGAAATISVKRLTGTTTLTVDGKTDASNRGDMLTQALVAHLPLLLHAAPKDVAIVGLGSGVTVGAALTHDPSRVDVLEISPEVVEASRFFETENRGALADARVRLIVGDGRTHMRLARRQYDVVVSEPSNPWIAGVAALFTQEYFTEVRARLRPGGMFCQWVNAYNISEADLQAVRTTFAQVFPGARAVLVGDHDVLLVGAAASLEEQPSRGLVDLHTRPRAAEDLARHNVTSLFALRYLVTYPVRSGRSESAVPPLDDDHMRLEFSTPREIHRRGGDSLSEDLPASSDDAPPPATGTVDEWRGLGQMHARADAHARALYAFLQALRRDSDDVEALDGFVRSATLLRRASDGRQALESVTEPRDASVVRLVARSKLLAAAGDIERARQAAHEAVRLDPARPEGYEQVAWLAADTGDSAALGAALGELARGFPERASTQYFRAVAALLNDDAPVALAHAESAIARDPKYAAVYDLAGAALTKLGRHDEARAMFERSLTFDAHDSSAYTNLGLLDLAAGRADQAASRFAEALWLDATSATARAGLDRALALRR